MPARLSFFKSSKLNILILDYNYKESEMVHTRRNLKRPQTEPSHLVRDNKQESQKLKPSVFHWANFFQVDEVYTDTLSQVLIENSLLTEDEWKTVVGQS